MARIPAIDISVWDEGINLNEWKAKHGIGAVIVKCGGNEGGRYVDRCFADHMRKAQEAGLPAGVYFYTTSTTVNAAIEDADYCVNLIHGHALQLPVFMDVEDAKQFKLSPRELTDVIKAFCDRVQKRGYRAGLYTGGYAFNNNMYPEELRQYCTWIASWQASWPSYVGKIDAWQQGTKRLSDGQVFYDDVSGCQDFDWIENYVIQGGGKVPTAKTGWAETLETCQDPADYAYCTCKVYSCGYSQPKRDHLTIERLKAGTAETDCSYGVGWWLFKGGYLSENPAFYTAIERAYLAEHGFDVIDANAGFVKMQRNDVLLRERNDARGVTGHTALYIGEGMQAEALRTERHDAGYDGSTPGDQDQGETVVRKLTMDWDYILRKREQPSYEPSGGEETVIESGGIDMGILIHPKNENKIYHWTCSMDEVPYHVSGPEKTAIEHAYALVHSGKRIPTIEMEQADFDAILSGTKARKAWREEGIVKAIATATCM